MYENMPMSVLLIEDDAEDCLKFEACANRREDIKFVGITDSSKKGLEMVKAHLPEAVILDLQLTKGEGSGVQFLQKLNEADLPFRPIIAITSSNQSKIVDSCLEELGKDWYFCKREKDYSEDSVFHMLLSLRSHAHRGQRAGGANDRTSIESPEEKQNRIYARIDAELDYVGIRRKYKGQTYLRDAIYFQITSKDPASAIEQVNTKYKITYNSVFSSMQTAINDAWKNSPPDELAKYYTARINPKTGVPVPSEIIYYYAEKISRSI